jgi:hypothetical protein
MGIFKKYCNLQQRIKKFKQHIVLKNLIGVLILCTFLLSITPKQFLHTVLADHKDTPAKKSSDRLQFNQQGFNCDCNSVVATSPFTAMPLKLEIPNPVPVNCYTVAISRSLLSVPHFYYKLRGPPAIV